MSLKIALLSNLEEALVLASIRNQCRHLLTNDQSEITQSKQAHWFNEIYTRQNPQSYKVWLLKEDDSVIGYFAAKETEEGVYITEGLAENRRGIGLGTYLLSSMIKSKIFSGKTLYADIFNDNHPSVNLHKKFGFKEHNQMNVRVTRFILEC